MSPDEEKVQMGLWSIFASSMLMSVDLRVINSRSKALLLNKGAISISQDVLGIPGRRVLSVRHDTCLLFFLSLIPYPHMHDNSEARACAVYL
jgi:hypothetical protein